MKHIAIIISTLLITQCTQTRNKIEQPHDGPPSWTLIDFVKADSINPILTPSDHQLFYCPLSGRAVKWEERNVLNPSAVVRNDTVYLLYRAQDSTGTSRIGLAFSEDGLHFEKLPSPVLYPDSDSMREYEWDKKREAGAENCSPCFDGMEDPRVVEGEDGTYIVTYTSYDGQTARLSLASSKDLKSWTKHGLVLKKDPYKNMWSKSGAIITQQTGDRIIATKINGKYWMYFGDTNIFLAYSDDLINWEPAENDETHKMIAVLTPRAGYFDSRLVEPGPFALSTDDGILLIYNGSNAANFNDPSLPRFTYAAGQALYDLNAPHKLIDRTESHFIHPDKDYERVGEVNEVCFVEGLAHFKGRWFLYYGTADSKIAVAVKQ